MHIFLAEVQYLSLSNALPCNNAEADISIQVLMGQLTTTIPSDPILVGRILRSQEGLT